jgi:hypothetical protein
VFQKFLIGMSSIMIATSIAQAGGVGSGGGGTTVPDPSSAADIETAIQQDARLMIEAWLFRQEKNYHEQTLEVRMKNPLRKIFDFSLSMHQIISRFRVEIRKDAPCLDSAKNPVDGSVFGRERDSICMSVFSMAPKLTKYNYKAEAFALLVHEYSHLAGTTEEEAVAIQKVALQDFSVRDPAELVNQAKNYLQAIDYKVIPYLNSWIKEPTQPATWNRLETALLNNGYQDVDAAFEADGVRYLLVSRGDNSVHGAEFIRLCVLRALACSQDESIPQETRKLCAKDFENAFRGADSATLNTISGNLGLTVVGVDPVVAQTMIMYKPTTWDRVRQELSAMKSSFLGMRMNLVNLKDSKISTYN